MSRLLAILGLLIANGSGAWASGEDPHLVGWFNTFIPGGGQLLLGHPWIGLEQAAIEVGAFGLGYSFSARSPLTLDGVPENYPGLNTSLGTLNRPKTVCIARNPTTGKCTQFGPTTTTSPISTVNLTPVDLTRPIAASILQEIGIKYHMVNVFESYRQALVASGEDQAGQGLDIRPVSSMLLDPFRWENLSDPWVFAPILASIVAIGFDYGSTMGAGLSPTQPLTGLSNATEAFNQLAVYPVGSGAPEEMFYRGFIQNELYLLTGTPFLSIPLSALCFGYSHSPEGRLSAALSGAYLGWLAHKNRGRLGPGITLHFWTVVVLGVESYLITKKSQASGAPVALQFTLRL